MNRLEDFAGEIFEPDYNPPFKHAATLREFASAMVTLAELAPERMTMAQGIFFLMAAAADMSGRPATFSQIRDSIGPVINRSLHSTYRVLLDSPNRKDNPRQKGLDWLLREVNPNDEREKFLRLTPKGREVAVRVIQRLTLPGS